MAHDTSQKRWRMGELPALGLRSLQDPARARYEIPPLTVMVFAGQAIKCRYMDDLAALAVRRREPKVAQFIVDEHTRRLRRWCREQIVLPPARRRRVMVVAP